MDRERFLEPSARIGSEAEAEFADGFLRYAAVFQIVARRSALDSVELRHEPVLGRRHDVMKGGTGFLPLRRARIGGRDFHLRLGGQILHRIHEAKTALFGHPADRVAMRAAAETMVEAFFVVDREAWRFLVMKRAAGLVFAACFLHLDGAPDQGRQRDTRESHRSNVIIWRRLVPRQPLRCRERGRFRPPFYRLHRGYSLHLAPWAERLISSKK